MKSNIMIRKAIPPQLSDKELATVKLAASSVLYSTTSIGSSNLLISIVMS